MLVCGDRTIVDYLMEGSSGNLQVGETVTVYGYDTGTIDAKNKLGGTTTELAVLGNAFEKSR